MPEYKTETDQKMKQEIDENFFTPLADNTIGGAMQFIAEGIRGLGPHVWTKTLPEAIGFGTVGGAITGAVFTAPGLAVEYCLKQSDYLKDIGTKIKNKLIMSLLLICSETTEHSLQVWVFLQ